MEATAEEREQEQPSAQGETQERRRRRRRRRGRRADEGEAVQGSAEEAGEAEAELEPEREALEASGGTAQGLPESHAEGERRRRRRGRRGGRHRRGRDTEVREVEITDPRPTIEPELDAAVADFDRPPGAEPEAIETRAEPLRTEHAEAQTEPNIPRPERQPAPQTDEAEQPQPPRRGSTVRAGLLPRSRRRRGARVRKIRAARSRRARA